MTDKFQYSDSELKDLLNGIYSGAITEYAIPESLYLQIANYLKAGLYEGFGGNLLDFTGKDLELLEDLRTNTFLFSGGKAYHQIKEYRTLLLDDSGNLRSQREFTQLAAKEFETWNVNWGLSERQTAIGQAQMAVKWNEIERNADILPILEFSTNGKPCEICAPYNNFSAPVTDKVWNWATPLLHFNCECILLQHEDTHAVSSKEKYNEIQDRKETVPEVFQMNSGKDKVIYSESHPYFEVSAKDKEYAKNNFNLPIPSKD